jgi:iron complex outermembrane receptor protein
MNKKPPIAWIVLTTSLFAYTALSARSAIAQVGADEVIDEIEVIVTIGSRRTGRTNINTAVPIDVFSREDLDSISSDDMLDTIEKLVPSFIVPVGGGDGLNFVRPALMRGLSADKLLVLVNGKRRHRSALVKLSSDGAHGPDLATIPSIAVRSIEVLQAAGRQ